MKRALFVLSVCALAACTPPAETPEPETPEPETPVAIDQSTGGACATVDAFIDLMGMETVTMVSGYTIMAEPAASVACSEPVDGAVECAVTGPSNIRVEIGPTSFTNYVLQAGQSGTLTAGPSGEACYLNANGG